MALSWTGTVPPHDYRLQRVASLVDPAGVRRLACDGVRYFVQASLTSEREAAKGEHEVTSCPHPPSGGASPTPTGQLRRGVACRALVCPALFVSPSPAHRERERGLGGRGD